MNKKPQLLFLWYNDSNYGENYLLLISDKASPVDNQRTKDNHADDKQKSNPSKNQFPNCHIVIRFQ